LIAETDGEDEGAQDDINISKANAATHFMNTLHDILSIPFNRLWNTQSLSRVNQPGIRNLIGARNFVITGAVSNGNTIQGISKNNIINRPTIIRWIGSHRWGWSVRWSVRWRD